MKKKLIPVLAVCGVIFLIVLTIGISILTQKYSPGKEYADLNEYFASEGNDDIAIVLNNELNENKAFSIDGEIYLDYQFIHDYLNPRFYWDVNENILLYTTDKELISVNADSSSYTVAKSQTDFGKVIVKANSESAYVAIDFIKQYTNFSYELFENPSRIVINNNFGDIYVATAKKATQLRIKGGIKSDILKDVTKGEELTVLETGDKWSKVASNDGFIGYVMKKKLSDSTTKTLKSDFTEETFSHILKDKEISMAWHQVTSKYANNNIAKILASTKGINVISPTWFHLNDNEGNLADYASKDYVDYCHKQGIEVWALFNNLDNPKVDSEKVLTHTSTRQNLVNQIIANAIKYELDGINIDFEALNSSVGDSYIQFIRELSVKCGNNGIVLSVDNYVPSDYTAFYNRKEQALFADYVVIMGYDEHYAGSDAGSVASLSWVDEGVANTLESVPANQVILGMPFYTRLWEINPKDGSEADTNDGLEYDVSSTVYGMNGGQEVLDTLGKKSAWSSEAGQDYAEWKDKDTTYKIWLENEKSTEERLKVIDKYSLAGAAYWKLGLEKKEVWDTIIKYIN
ncbi:MAG: glycosyl hydrolase family 18 protein [Agathobacter sp.]|nr:glycosyl hydrolase family 18 protein [Agathobacter sp.]